LCAEWTLTLSEGVEDAEERTQHPSLGKIINQVYPGTGGLSRVQLDYVIYRYVLLIPGEVQWCVTS